MSIYQKPLEEISLSAEGIGFGSREYIPVETHIRTRMLLPQNPQILIATFGQGGQGNN